MKSFSELANPWIESLLTYEPGRPIEEVARELGFADSSEIDKLASNENALGPSPKAIRAMREHAGAMHRYPDGGAYYLKGALARKLGVAAEQILPGNGSNELLELIGHVFLSPDAGIVMAERAFVVYRLIAMAAQAPVVTVPMKDYTHDLQAMLTAVTPDTRVVFVSNPNNPTSTMVSPAEIESFMQRVPDDVIVCFDEAYIELLPPEIQPDTLRYVKEGRNVIVLRTFSKAYGLAGLRIGYAVAPEACVALLNKMRQPFNVNAMALAAAEAALEDEAHVVSTREMVRQGTADLTRAFEELQLPFVPPVVNFVLVDVSRLQGGETCDASLTPGRRVFERLQKQGVIVRPMDGYGLPGHVRITVGMAEENRRCVEALRALAPQ